VFHTVQQNGNRVWPPWGGITEQSPALFERSNQKKFPGGRERGKSIRLGKVEECLPSEAGGKEGDQEFIGTRKEKRGGPFGLVRLVRKGGEGGFWLSVKVLKKQEEKESRFDVSGQKGQRGERD